MLYPSINELTEMVDSKYTLVMIIAKRARQIVDNSKPLVETDAIKPVSIAIEEMSEGKIEYKKPNIKSIK